MATTTSVYQAIAAVSADLAKLGIAKLRSNAQQGYRFRGIDDVLNALAPILAKHGLVILPRILSRTVTERATAKGGALFSVVVEAEFDLIAASDGSTHTIRVYGEAMDSADKATNKAMSAAYKYAAFLAFCIPLEGTPDADEVTPEVAAKAPDGAEDWLIDLEAVATTGTPALRAAWKESRLDYRQWLTDRHPEKIDALKLTAARVELPA